MLAGDLVDRGNERTNWDHFFLRAAPVFDHVPVMPCVGNHEYLDIGPRLYRAFFELPRNGPRGIDPDLVYHSRPATPASPCWTARSPSGTPWPPAGRRNGSTDAGADEGSVEVRDLPPSRLSVASLARHAGPARALGARSSTSTTSTSSSRDTTTPISGRIRSAATGASTGPADGTIYVIAVSGDKFVDQAHRDYIEVGLTGVSTYQTIEIDPRVEPATYRAWTEDGRVVDELHDRQSPNGPTGGLTGRVVRTPVPKPLHDLRRPGLDRREGIRRPPEDHPGQRDPTAPVGSAARMEAAAR